MLHTRHRSAPSIVIGRSQNVVPKCIKQCIVQCIVQRIVQHSHIVQRLVQCITCQVCSKWCSSVVHIVPKCSACNFQVVPPHVYFQVVPHVIQVSQVVPRPKWWLCGAKWHTWYLSTLVHCHIIKACKKYTTKTRQNSQNWSKWAKIGQNFAFCMLKGTPARKKYTTAQCAFWVLCLPSNRTSWDIS